MVHNSLISRYLRPKEPWFRIIVLTFLISYALMYNAAAAGPKVNAGQTDQKQDINQNNYIIGPTDVLEIQVWREPNLSRTVPVRPDGKITLPLLDDVHAAGLTPLELKAKLEEALSKYIANPTVSVSVQEIHSKNIYVMGKVNSPGPFPLQQGLTVLQALSLAGGLAEWADEDNIIIIRTENGQQKKIKFDYSKVAVGKDLNQNILLKPGDTIIVP